MPSRGGGSAPAQRRSFVADGGRVQGNATLRHLLATLTPLVCLCSYLAGCNVCKVKSVEQIGRLGVGWAGKHTLFWWLVGTTVVEVERQEQTWKLRRGERSRAAGCARHSHTGKLEPLDWAETQRGRKKRKPLEAPRDEAVDVAVLCTAGCCATCNSHVSTAQHRARKRRDGRGISSNAGKPPPAE